MKIKRILTAGKEAGNIVELTPTEKVIPTLQDGVIGHELFKDKIHAWVRETTITKVTEASRGNPLGNWSNNAYYAEGECQINRRDTEKDMLLRPLRYSFTLEFHDCLDTLGQPDTKVTRLDLVEKV